MSLDKRAPPCATPVIATTGKATIGNATIGNETSGNVTRQAMADAALMARYCRKLLVLSAEMRADGAGPAGPQPLRYALSRVERLHGALAAALVRHETYHGVTADAVWDSAAWQAQQAGMRSPIDQAATIARKIFR